MRLFSLAAGFPGLAVVSAKRHRDLLPLEILAPLFPKRPATKRLRNLKKRDAEATPTNVIFETRAGRVIQ
ncbi:hypothetical protein J25TS5_46110 [Paenibacillus faecis]|nr:hypothetical protein J25TS5_46110 [Paenibacillus faecis]